MKKMDKIKKIQQNTAKDIYELLLTTYYATTDEAVKFRINYGTNGVVNKVLNYIEEKYLKGR